MFQYKRGFISDLFFSSHPLCLLKFESLNSNQNVSIGMFKVFGAHRLLLMKFHTSDKSLLKPHHKYQHTAITFTGSLRQISTISHTRFELQIIMFSFFLCICIHRFTISYFSFLNKTQTSLNCFVARLKYIHFFRLQFVQVPIVYSIGPTFGPRHGNTIVTITGNNLDVGSNTYVSMCSLLR